jgi:putative membrane protein insertion efficiency factor
MIAKLCHWLGVALGLVVILPVKFYQIAIGPLLPRVCKYHPSCSEYFVQAVTKYGAVRGSCKGIWRICRCNPFVRGGYDPP